MAAAAAALHKPLLYNALSLGGSCHRPGCLRTCRPQPAARDLLGASLVEHTAPGAVRQRHKHRPCKRGFRCAAALGLPLTPSTLFTVATVAVMPIYALLLGFPRKQLTERVVRSSAFFVVAGLLYTGTLLAWAPMGLWAGLSSAYRSSLAFPDVSHLAVLFKQVDVTTVAWMHLLLLDLFQARGVFLDGCRSLVPTAHSVVLCFMFGPVGFLSHFVTKGIVRLWRKRQGLPCPELAT